MAITIKSERGIVRNYVRHHIRYAFRKVKKENSKSSTICIQKNKDEHFSVFNISIWESEKLDRQF